MHDSVSDSMAAEAGGSYLAHLPALAPSHFAFALAQLLHAFATGTLWMSAIFPGVGKN